MKSFQKFGPVDFTDSKSTGNKILKPCLLFIMSTDYPLCFVIDYNLSKDGQSLTETIESHALLVV